MDKPLISVIIPTYNRAHLIEESIKSVLVQTYKNIEIIVVDDASDDDTEEIIKNILDTRIVYLKNNSNKGPSASRNYGVSVAKGDLISFHDSDDFCMSDKLEKQQMLFQNSKQDLGFVYCGFEIIDYNTRNFIKKVIYKDDFYQILTKGNYLTSPANITYLIPKNIFMKIGGYDERLFAHEDTELAIRLLKNYQCEGINESLAKVTRNHSQLMSNTRNYILASQIIYEKHNNFLSQQILFGLCKQIANYYILSGDLEAGKKYTELALKHNSSDTKTEVILKLIKYFPTLLKLFYSLKFKKQIPNTSGIEN